MSDSSKTKLKTLSPLVQAVVALDDYFSELERLGIKIRTMDLKSDFDFEHAQRLMSRFAECGQGISTEVANLSTHLNDLRARAEEVASGVSERADQLALRKSEEQKKFDEFRDLGERVRELNTRITEFKGPPDADALAAIDVQLNGLIGRAQALRGEAHEAKMRTLEQNADSLTQTLQSVRQKLGGINPAGAGTVLQ